MIKLKHLMKENSKSTYSFGCVMLNLKFDELKKIQSHISPNDIYAESSGNTYGLEDEPHITLLYGLHAEVTNSDVKKICDSYKFTDLIAHDVSLFKNDKYDVLKFNIRYPTRGGNFLRKCNSELRKLPHTNTYPDYIPHMTIAYINPGMGEKYVDILRNAGLDEFQLTPQYVSYSKPNDELTYMQINSN